MMGLVFLTAAGLALAVDIFLIQYFHRREMHQAIRDCGPESHQRKKKTPSMGGVAFGVVFMVFMLIFGRSSSDLWVAVVSLCGAVLGGLDDWWKVSGKNKHGLKARTKIIVLSVASVLFGVHLLATHADVQRLPFGLGEWSMGLLIIPFAFGVINATANAVNLTDGLDGLLGGLTLIALLTLFMQDGFQATREPLGWMLPVVGGAVGGFLLVNLHPARIFMGDTGSLFLGTFLAAWCLKQGLAWFIPLFGLVFVAEALSVVIQVTLFRTTGKRFFKMSPLHHHFELSGFHETEVVRGFWMVALGVSGVVLLWA